MNEEEKLEVFAAKKDTGKITIMEDPALDSDMRFYHDGAKILFIQTEHDTSKLYSITMRK